MNTEKQARPEILSQNQKDLQTQGSNKLLKRFLDKNSSLAEKICTLFREHDITVFSILTALSMTISTIVLAIASVLGGGKRGGSPSKDKEVLKKCLDRLADALKRPAGKAAEALPAIVGSVVGAILSFLGKTVGFVAEHAWALIVFIVGLIGVWVMQRVQKK